MWRWENLQDQGSGSEEVHRTFPCREGLRQACCFFRKSPVGEKQILESHKALLSPLAPLRGPLRTAGPPFPH